jgi:hypothetical protein
MLNLGPPRFLWQRATSVIAGRTWAGNNQRYTESPKLLCNFYSVCIIYNGGRVPYAASWPQIKPFSCLWWGNGRTPHVPPPYLCRTVKHLPLHHTSPIFTKLFYLNVFLCTLDAASQLKYLNPCMDAEFRFTKSVCLFVSCHSKRFFAVWRTSHGYRLCLLLSDRALKQCR